MYHRGKISNVEKKQQDEFQLHLFVSNQSFSIPISNLKICIDDRKIFDQEMTTGTQHNWEQVTISITKGKYLLVASESKTRTRKTEVVNVDRELWIAVTFHSPPQFMVNVFDHPIAFM